MLLTKYLRFFQANQKFTHTAMADRKELNKLRTIIINAQSLSEIDEIFFKTSKREEIFSHFFSIACRGYSRVIRNMNENQYFNMQSFLGKELQNLHKIHLDQLDCKELCDICNFFSVVHHRMSIDVQNPYLIEFLSKLLRAIFRDQTKIDNFRKISHRLKALRCAEQYQIPYYSDLLQHLEDKFNDFLLFDYMALMNSILRGKPNSKVFLLEKKLLLSAIRKIVDKKWIQISSPHSFNDLIYPIAQFQSILPYVFEGREENQLWQTTEDYLFQNASKLSGEQIIRYLKALEKVKPNSKFSTKLIQSIFCRINSQTGQTSLDPLFITRLIAHHKNFKLYQRQDPQWEQKFFSMIQYYFFTHKVNTKAVIEGIFTLLGSEGFSPQNRLKIFKSIKEDLKLDQSSRKQASRYLIGLLKFSVRAFEINETTQLLEDLQRQYCVKPEGNFFYYHLLKEFNIIFLRKMGSFIESDRKRFLINKSIRINDYNDADVYSYLKSLGTLERSVSSTVRNVNRVNIIYLEASIELLRYNLMYEEFFKLLESVRVGSSILNIVFNRITDLQIPIGMHQQLTRLILVSLRNTKTLTSVLFNMIRNIKNKKKRASRLQAQYFLSFVTQQTPQSKALFLADKETLCFLLCFEPEKTLEILFSLFQQEGIPLSSIQHVLVHSLFYLERNIDDLFEIFKFQQRLSATPGLSSEAHSDINKIMNKYRQEDSMGIFLISQICKKPIFKDIKQNRQQLEKISEILLLKKDQNIEETLEGIVRLLAFLEDHKWNQKRESSLFIGQLFARKLRDLTLLHEQSNALIVKAFIVCYQFRWNIPEIYNQCLKIINSDDWKNFIPAEMIFTRLCLFPHDEGLKKQQIPDLIELYTYNPEQLLPYLEYLMARKHSQLKDTYLMNYLTYVQNVDFMKKKKHGKVKGPKKSQFNDKKQLNCQ